MNHRFQTASWRVALAGLVLVAGSAGAAPPTAGAPLQYQATLVDTNAALPHLASVPIRIVLERTSSDEETADLDRALASGREGAVTKQLTSHFVGRLEVDGRIGEPIGFARRYRDAEGEHLILVTRRELPRRELFSLHHSTLYPWRIVDLVLDDGGFGAGRMVVAARLKTQSSDGIRAGALGFVPERLLGVRPL